MFSHTDSNKHEYSFPNCINRTRVYDTNLFKKGMIHDKTVFITT